MRGPKDREGGAAPAWLQLADAVIGRLAGTRMESGPGEEELDRNVAAAREAFAAELEEPTPFTALIHNAGLAVDEAEVLAVAAAVEADPSRERLIAAVYGDATLRRLALHTVASLFPGGHLGVRAAGPDGALRRAALIDVVEEGPWATHEIVVRPPVMWALVGDQSRDPELPLGTSLVLGDEDTAGGYPFVAVTGDDRVRRLQQAAHSTAGHRFVVASRPAHDTEWAALVREATIVGAGIIVELDDDLPPDGRRWIERATHLSWVLSSRVELPLEQMPDRPWIDCHAPPHEPTDAEWTAALGDTPRTHRLTAAQLRLVERTHSASDGDLDAAVRRLAGGYIDRLARRIRPTRRWDDIVLAPERLQLLRELCRHHSSPTRPRSQPGRAAFGRRAQRLDR